MEGEALNTRGLAAYSLGRLDDALADVRTSLAVHQRAGDALREIIRLSNLGGLSQLADRHFDAQQHYERALTRIGENASEPWAADRRAVVVANLASLYQRIGRYQRALDLYLGSARESEIGGGERIQKLAVETGSRREELHATLYLAETRRRLGKLERARADYLKALTQARDLGVAEERWKALYGLGRIAEAQADGRQAEQLYRRSIESVESLRSRLEVDTLRRGFLADRMRPYQALVELLLRSSSADPTCGDADFRSELLGWIAAQRSRTVPSRSSGSAGAAEPEALRKELAEAWKRRRVPTAIGRRRRLRRADCCWERKPCRRCGPLPRCSSIKTRRLKARHWSRLCRSVLRRRCSISRVSPIFLLAPFPDAGRRLGLGRPARPSLHSPTRNRRRRAGRSL